MTSQSRPTDRRHSSLRVPDLRPGAGPYFPTSPQSFAPPLAWVDALRHRLSAKRSTDRPGR